MEFGKNKRLNNILRHKDSNLIIVPLDHGFTLGPISGIENIGETIKKLSQYNINAFILHKGIIRSYSNELLETDIPIIMHLSASTYLNPVNNYKVNIGSVEEAISLGCDAVSIQINLGSEHESEMIYEAGIISEKCYQYGMPLLAMMYARGKNINNETDVETIKMVTRVGAEIGADLIKTCFCGRSKEFQNVVVGCPVPIIVAGGEKCKNEEEFLNNMKIAMSCGVRGVGVGRNIFQSNNLDFIMKELNQIVHGK